MPDISLYLRNLDDSFSTIDTESDTMSTNSSTLIDVSKEKHKTFLFSFILFITMD